jgi:magnesium-protoporphyrin O-methyltransferase
VEAVFDAREAKRRLKRYRRRGPDRTTQMLIEALVEVGVAGAEILDIGGGVGAISHALLAAGARSSTHVDASSPYLEVAREESERRRNSDRITFRFGDFVELAPTIPPADAVTLDRVICCYPGMEQLVGLSAAHATRVVGAVYPLDNWWMRMASPAINLFLSFRGIGFRSYIHPTAAVDAVLRAHGPRMRSRRRTIAWQVVVYSR